MFEIKKNSPLLTLLYFNDYNMAILLIIIKICIEIYLFLKLNIFEILNSCYLSLIINKHW